MKSISNLREKAIWFRRCSKFDWDQTLHLQMGINAVKVHWLLMKKCDSHSVCQKPKTTSYPLQWLAIDLCASLYTSKKSQPSVRRRSREETPTIALRCRRLLFIRLLKHWLAYCRWLEFDPTRRWGVLCRSELVFLLYRWWYEHLLLVALQIVMIIQFFCVNCSGVVAGGSHHLELLGMILPTFTWCHVCCDQGVASLKLDWVA